MVTLAEMLLALACEAAHTLDLSDTDPGGILWIFLPRTDEGLFAQFFDA